MKDTSKPQTTIQSLRRGLNALEVVAASPSPMSGSDIATRLGMPLPTTFHLLATLVEAGYLMKERRRYLTGPKIAELHDAFARHLRPSAGVETAMHAVADTTRETTYISRWHHGDLVVAAVCEATQVVRISGVYVGLRGNPHARAAGKVLLAYGPPHRVAEVTSRPLAALTPNTITDPARLEDELQRVRERGFAIDREEFLPGVCCVAAPFLEPDGIANVAVTVAVPADRFDDGEAELIRQMLTGVAAATGQRHAGTTTP